MEKRIVKRQAGKVLAAAVAAAGLVGLASSSANASLLVDLRAATVTGGGSVVAGSNGKSVTGVQPGSVVTMDLFARITGANTTQAIGDNGDGTFSTQNDDSLQILVGSFKSSAGGLKGDIAKLTSTTQNPQVWNGAGSSAGTQLDADADTDLDIGQYNSTDSATMWIGRSADKTGVLYDGAGGKLYSSNGSNNAKNSIISPSTSELYMGSIKFTVASGGPSSDVNFVLRPQSSGTAALWFEDGSAAGKDPYTPGAYSTGTPVNIAAVPEPASIGLLGIASVGLLARRRDKKA